MTEWNEFRGLDLHRVRALMAGPVIVDARNVLDPAQTRALGFAYFCTGRQQSAAVALTVAHERHGSEDRRRSVVVHDRPSRELRRVRESPMQASAYHSPVWLDVIHRAFGHDTTYLVAESAGAICGVLPLVFFRSRLFGRFTVSVPFVNYGGVLADNEATARALLDRAIDETCRTGGAHLELRHCDKQMFRELAPQAPQSGDGAVTREHLGRAVAGARPQAAQPGPEGREERARG